MAMQRQESVTVGKHYRRTDYRYDETRWLFAIENGEAFYVRVSDMKIKSVSLKTFSAWAKYELHRPEVAAPYALFLEVNGKVIWHTHKPGHSRMSFWYSIHPQALYCDMPCTMVDQSFIFDVRDLPERFTAGLDIQTDCSSNDISRLERRRRELCAHTVAIARAIDAGHDFEAWINECRLKEIAEAKAAQAKGWWLSDPVSASDTIDSDIPF